MQLSIFKNYTDKQPLDGTLESIAALMRSDKSLETLTLSYRQTGNKTFKSECPLFAVGCRFKGGKGKDNATGLTGLSMVDFDHIEDQSQSQLQSQSPLQLPQGGETQLPPNATPSPTPSPFGGTEGGSYISSLKAKIIADPHTLMCYTTISGKGLRVIFKYERSPLQSQSPLQLQSQSPLQLPQGGESQLPPIATPSLTPSPLGGTEGGSCSEGGYQSAFFCGNAYYEKLLGIKADMQCKNITRLSGLAYDPDVFIRPEGEVVPFSMEEMTAATVNHAKESKEKKQMQRIQTYFDTFIAPQLAKANIVFESGSHNNYVMRVGYLLAERRFSKRLAVRWAIERFGKDYPDTEQVITSCFNATAPSYSLKGERKDCRFASVEEIKAFLDGHVSLRFNVITNRVEFKSNTGWEPISDRFVNSLWSQMSAVTRVNKQDLYSIIESDYVPLYHPFKEYLSSLPDWKEGDHDYIADLAATVTVKSSSLSPSRETEGAASLWYRHLKKWLVGMVAGWISDDVVNNVILVLIGEQGAYKTTWFNYLMPPELKQYFYTKTNAHRMSKDDLLTLAQYGLVCCEELDTMRPSELNQLKATVTMLSIDERAAYARYHEHRKHIASFCGTGNNTQFLSDPTGNRRWLPFEVESILSPREHPFNYTGIYSQALALYMNGFQYWFTKDEIKEQNRHNKQFETPRLEHELVDLYFRKPTEAELGEFMSVAHAIQIISNGISQKLSAVNVGRAFSDLGFKRVRTKNSRGFIVVCRTAEEIKAYQRRLSADAQPDTDNDLPF